MTLSDKRILLIISGGIAAYKALELIRLLKKDGASVKCILTAGGQKFITPLSVASLSGEPCYTDLWSLKDETEMGHIRLSREADLIVVAPASANLIAKMAHGMADDLASTMLLASDKPVLIAPAMNVEMWGNPAVRYNIDVLDNYGVKRVGPASGDMACGEVGEGRMAEPEAILKAIGYELQVTGYERKDSSLQLAARNSQLKGLKALVTSGPTHEPIDPVRFIGNRSSGKQGHAIATALAQSGAQVTLITGPVSLPDPAGVETVHVETAAEMMEACKAALPADIAICAAAVGDWASTSVAKNKIKKQGRQPPPILKLKENPDILATLSRPYTGRPKLVVGFAAETGKLVEEAARKRKAKNCDWILANDVSEGVFGADTNHVWLIDSNSQEDWGAMSKQDIAQKLVERIGNYFKIENEKPASSKKLTRI
jgi:phosphopantothenoylcysteine decarboxylase/phosphopantothenate--cysteine ligase